MQLVEKIEITNRFAIDTEPGEETKIMEWIPCTERLPEKNGRYLVTRKFSSLDDVLSLIILNLWVSAWKQEYGGSVIL